MKTTSVSHNTLLKATMEIQKDLPKWKNAFDKNPRNAMNALAAEYSINHNAVKTIADALGFPRERRVTKADSDLETRVASLEEKVQKLMDNTAWEPQ
jgi:hypothetical protein